ncbi:hypothetical protein QRH42_004736 [Salmonella enterica]|nr:hypothetical protein [Salmonella enterica]ELT8526565.1 hypothetical protein [Salmonella enterica]
MTLTIAQQKERLKRELARLTEREKNLKIKAAQKNIKAINAEILKYSEDGTDDLKKIIGLLVLFYKKDQTFKNAVLDVAEEELKGRKAGKVGKTPRRAAEAAGV